MSFQVDLRIWLRSKNSFQVSFPRKSFFATKPRLLDLSCSSAIVAEKYRKTMNLPYTAPYEILRSKASPEGMGLYPRSAEFLTSVMSIGGERSMRSRVNHPVFDFRVLKLHSWTIEVLVLHVRRNCSEVWLWSYCRRYMDFSLRSIHFAFQNEILENRLNYPSGWTVNSHGLVNYLLRDGKSLEMGVDDYIRLPQLGSNSVFTLSTPLSL